MIRKPKKQKVERPEKSKERIKQNGEVFTPKWLAQEMIDKIPDDFWKDPSKTILEPACGDGIFVELCVLKKLKFKNRLFTTVRNVYALDIMKDNVKATRQRILKIIIEKLDEKFSKKVIDKDQYLEHYIELAATVNYNIKVTKDTLSFDFESMKPFVELKDKIKEKLKSRVCLKEIKEHLKTIKLEKELTKEDNKVELF
jgi:hypothetical protein